MDRIQRVVDLIQQAHHCVAFTGAGISTLSGIRDFRGKNGLYKQPETAEMFDIDVFHQNPSIYYRLASEFIYGLDKKEPSIVHTVLAKLEAQGILKAVITQNIDLLHQKAGSKTIFEIHGSPEIHTCQNCKTTFPFSQVMHIAEKGEVPHCKKCGGVLKPNITFFGESLPLHALKASEEHAKKADVMLVLGSSLTVYPAAALPEITVHSGGKLVIVNEQATHLDRYSTVHLSDLQETFEALDKCFL